MTLFFQILIVILLLGAMIVVLLGIGQLSKMDGFENNYETYNLKKEIENTEEVISRNNVFHKLIEEKQRVEKDNSFHHGNQGKDNDPSSRKL